MTLAQVIVNIVVATPRRGAPTDTGVAFMVYPGTGGPDAPTEFYSKADATAAGVPEAYAAFIGDALLQGAPKVIAVRAAAVDAENVTEAEWTTALDLFSTDYGPGQVLIPGIATPAAHAALLDHADRHVRFALLDHAVDADATSIESTLAGLSASAGASMATLAVDWATAPVSGGSAREIPASVLLAGLIARADALAGHAGLPPAGTHRGGVGVLESVTGLVSNFTRAELTTLDTLGASVFQSVLGSAQLRGWRTLGEYKQAQTARIVMQLRYGFAALGEQFLWEPIDGEGRLYSEYDNAIRAFLMPLWTADPPALYGSTADEAFTVDVHGVNSPATAARGELIAAIEATLTRYPEKVIFNVYAVPGEGVAA